MTEGLTGLSQDCRPDTCPLCNLKVPTPRPQPQFRHLWNEVNVTTHLVELL